MPRTRIKICGITRPQDARAAAHAGADAIGLVFDANAGRVVTVDQAAEIIAGLPALITTVGLFVNAHVATIRGIVLKTHVGVVQLHGNESPESVARLKPIPVIKALRVDQHLKEQLQKWRASIDKLQLTNLVGFVMETPSTHAPGGTGISNDWPLLARHIQAGDFVGLPPIIAAGGLTPENVGDVVRTIRPWVVDVSSGVESARREKSEEKIRAFVRAVAKADAEL